MKFKLILSLFCYLTCVSAIEASARDGNTKTLFRCEALYKETSNSTQPISVLVTEGPNTNARVGFRFHGEDYLMYSGSGSVVRLQGKSEVLADLNPLVSKVSPNNGQCQYESSESPLLSIGNGQSVFVRCGCISQQELSIGDSNRLEELWEKVIHTQGSIAH